MSIEHPITPPPPELVRQWIDERPASEYAHTYLAIQAARWGADQELEACCADLRMAFSEARADWLRSARRPKPPSLAEQGLAALKRQAVLSVPSLVATNDCEVIRAALKRLQELEQQENNDN